jgi:fermentation-respiration switch protein FrsA (DUF1100 family)
MDADAVSVSSRHGAELVHFDSEGVGLEALLFLPEGSGPFPAVVLAGGWCYVKELVQPVYANACREAGVAALVFDYRGMGTSGGEPRQHLDPDQQIEDYRNAISYLELRDDIDGNAIGIWGISYSGGHVLIAGARDPRVRCIVAIVPVVDGLATMQRAHGTMGFRRLASEVLDARRELYRTGEHRYIKHSSENPEHELCTWPFPGSPPLFQWLKETQAPTYENRNTVASVEKLLEYSVWPSIERLIDTPTLMVLAEGDDFTMWDLEVRAFNDIPTPRKELHVVPRTGHHDLYRDTAKLDALARRSAAWLRSNLPGQQ